MVTGHGEGYGDEREKGRWCIPNDQGTKDERPRISIMDGYMNTDRGDGKTKNTGMTIWWATAGDRRQLDEKREDERVRTSVVCNFRFLRTTSRRSTPFGSFEISPIRTLVLKSDLL